MKIGAHVSASGGLAKALQRGADLGAEVIQVFLSSPRAWAFRNYEPGEAEEFRSVLSSSGLELVAHASYLINLASPDESIRKKSDDLLCATMASARLLDISAVILHTGSHRGEGLDRYRTQLVNSLTKAASVGGGTTRLLLENTAGSGGTIGARFEELADLIDSVGAEANLGVCLDTQHMFAAGYYFGDPDSVRAVVAELRSTVGAPVAVHLNDSKVPLGKGTDRHENIDEGEIGSKALGMLLTDQLFEESSVILEVPGAGDGPRKEDVLEAFSLLR